LLQKCQEYFHDGKKHSFRRPVRRSKIRKWLLKNQWLIIGVSFLIVFFLGFIGYKNYYAGPQYDFSVTSLLYISLQLFVLESSPGTVRMRHDSGLATLLNWNVGQFEHLKAFGLYDQTCRPEAILNGTLELLARAIHGRYLDQSKKLNKTDAESPSLLSWEELPDHLKESNRMQADHISMQLNRVQCEIIPQMDWDSSPFEFSEDEIENWQSWNISAGWMNGSARDGNSPKARRISVKRERPIWCPGKSCRKK
jgi:hypothetical protein